ncbi:MAG: hypothetical protein ACYDA4_16660 [Ignavibacteriaceae bacterium]
MKILFNGILLIAILIACNPIFGQTKSVISVNVDKKSGEYSILIVPMKWKFAGRIGRELTNLKSIKGHDLIGNYSEITFNWNDNNIYEGAIKWYDKKPVVVFLLTLLNNQTKSFYAFPTFTEFPTGINKFSFNNDNFAPPQFKLNETSTPWLFFDNKLNSFIISPASDFIVAKLTGDGNKTIGSGLNSEVKNLPSEFTHKTILVFANGIRTTWDIWGSTLRKIYNRKIPANDADPVLKYFGYWTDNGADYYYNYDTTLGYSQTLLSLMKRYKNEGIKLGYMQLDSWWYEKSIYDVNGIPNADHKNQNLPYGKWNRYGGLISYTADPFLFVNGLSSFDKKLNVPLITHSRWIDPTSPYRNKYKISGYAAVDPKYWDHIIKYIKSSGVICYEQDWLNYIYNKSPQMSEDLSIGNAFTNGMADACMKAGLSIQYCMAMPRYFLQGLKYNNLTSIRTSGDRFEINKWKHFLYTSQLAYECGIYPWCDVFKSNELGNMILDVLSSGPVGTGDAIGKEDKKNIILACRKDGVLVKPDVPILPIDEDYINDATKKSMPMLAYTYTKHGSITTGYVFAFTNDSTGSKEISFTPSQLGIKGKAIVFNPLTQEIKVIKRGKAFSGKLNSDPYTYYILAPLLPSGIAFLGDAGKIAATGKKRIADIRDDNGSVSVKVLFAVGESSVNLEGYSKYPVKSNKGEINYNKYTRMFNLILSSKGNKEVTVNLKAK